MTTDLPTAPALEFTLPGTWTRLPCKVGMENSAAVRSYVDRVVGAADDRAVARDKMRHVLGRTLATATEAGGRAMFISERITKGSPLALSFTVYEPPGLEMTPLAKTSPQYVADGLRAALAAMGKATSAELRELEIPGSVILTRHREESTVLLPEAKDLPIRTLVADYWYTIPDSKRISWVVFQSPLADIPHAMLRVFDHIVLASRWRAPQEMQT